MPEGEEGEEEREWLRAVLRHNAHGPEFKAYAQVCVCVCVRCVWYGWLVPHRSSHSPLF